MTSEHSQGPEPDRPENHGDQPLRPWATSSPPYTSSADAAPDLSRQQFAAPGAERRANGAGAYDPDATFGYPASQTRDVFPSGPVGQETVGSDSSRYDEYGRLLASPKPAPSDAGDWEPPSAEDAPVATQPPVKPSGHGALGFVIEVVKTLVLAAIIFLCVRAVVQNFRVEGSSMFPSFLDGEYLLVNRAVYARIDLNLVHKVLPFVHPGSNPERYIFHGPQRGDVIVFVPPTLSGEESKDFIKRVIGVPGDTISFADGHVFVNGRQVIEPYITQRTECSGQFCRLTLGKDQYFVMGDNRGNSSDSRIWGPVQANKVIGKALLSYWCSGPQCKGDFDHVGLSPNHSPQLAPVATNP
ncbi:MAG TPA: signal peptidase I [Dehalococcoidia bacterium]|nr:signal peptidase I [Dehalococcoidia bacterium]